MGYESRIYVIDKCEHESLKHGDKFWGEIVGSFDLSRVHGQVLDAISKYPKSNCYIFAEGDERTTDMYGDEFTEIPLEDMIEILEDAEVADHYRRYLPCIGMLKGFRKKDWGNLVVIHFGY
jgi:hypothetical protein